MASITDVIVAVAIMTIMCTMHPNFLPTLYITDSVLSMDGTFGLSAHIGNSPAFTTWACSCDASPVSREQIMEITTFLDFAYDSFK